jgi:hypothetical protein
MLRTLIAIVAGIVMSFGCVAAFDAASAAFFPPPPGLNFNDPAVLAAYVVSMPFAAQAIIAAGWFCAPYIGALFAMYIGRASLPGWIVAAAFLAAATFNIILIPHPQWMAIAAFVLPGLAAMAAQLTMSARIED